MSACSAPSCRIRANEFAPNRKALVVIAEKLRSTMAPADISGIMGEVEDLLDESIAPKDQGYVIRAPLGKTIGDTRVGKPAHWVDLSQVDFKVLKQQYEASRKHIEVERLREMINAKLKRLVRFNRMRMDYYEQTHSDRL